MLPIFATIGLFSSATPSLRSRAAAGLWNLAFVLGGSATLGVAMSMAITHTIFRIGYFCLIENRRLTWEARMVVTVALGIFSLVIAFKIAAPLVAAAEMRYLSSHLLPHELADGIAAIQHRAQMIAGLGLSEKVRDVATLVASSRNVFCQMLLVITAIESWNSSRLTLDDNRALLW